MTTLRTYIQDIESKSLRHKLQRIDDLSLLSEEQKHTRARYILSVWLFGVKLMHVLTFGLIRYFYNRWAEKNDSKSRWLDFKGVSVLQDFLHKPSSYTQNEMVTLLTNSPNWSRCIRVMLDSINDTQINHLITLSKEFNRPAIFIGDATSQKHFIAGIYWNNHLIIIDPKGRYHIQQLEKTLKDIFIHSTTNELQSKNDN